MLSRCCGTDSSILRVDHGTTYLQNYTWSISIYLRAHAVSHLGANKTPQAIVRVGKALGVLRNILEEFDKVTVGQVKSNHIHTTRSETEDLMKMVAELSHHDVFSHHQRRKFPTFECNRLMKAINQKKLDLWMTKKVCKILKLSPLSR